MKSPGEYEKQLEVMKRTLNRPITLVLPTLPSYARNRMVQMGIPFIVPGNQAFLPKSVIDLREHFPKTVCAPREKLSSAAQCTVIYHLRQKSLSGISLKEIASKVHYTPMTMTKVKDELESSGICKVTRKERSIFLDFSPPSLSFWNKVEPFLVSPIKRTCWVKWNAPIPRARLAGLSALSEQSALEDDRLPTYALSSKQWRESLEKNDDIRGCSDSDIASAKIEVWSYSPSTIRPDAGTVDPLSLYLSLRDSNDERVQQQLEQLIGEIQW